MKGGGNIESKLKAKKGIAPIVVAIAGCGCLLLFALAFAGIVALGVFALSNEDGIRSEDNIAFTNPQGLSDIVPPNFGSLFTEAGQHTSVAPAMVAAIYLTEKHSDSFGADLPSLDHRLEPCTENRSGAAGPMQFIPSSWEPVTKHLKEIGISNPDRCKFRDSIIGAAFLLRGKLGSSWVKEVCQTTNLHDIRYTDSCIYRWGQSYCGVPISGRESSTGCNHVNCGAPGYLYCEEVVRKFKLVSGGI